jgi:hypothetical protein
MTCAHCDLAWWLHMAAGYLSAAKSKTGQVQ